MENKTIRNVFIIDHDQVFVLNHELLDYLKEFYRDMGLTFKEKVIYCG